MKITKRLLAIAVAAVLLLGGGAANAEVQVPTTPAVDLPAMEFAGAAPAVGTLAVLPTCSATTLYGSGQWARRVPTTVSANRNCSLVQGNSGNAVKSLQLAVDYCEGYYVGNIDGSFGSLTKQGLMSFQSTYAPPADGWYGPVTHNALRFSSTLSTTGTYYCNWDTAI